MKIKITTHFKNFPNYSALNYSALRTNLKNVECYLDFFAFMLEMDFVRSVLT